MNIDSQPQHIETRPSGLMVIHDNFDHGLRPDIWSTKRIETGRFSYVQNAGRNALKVDLHQGDKQAVNSQGIITERSEISENPNILLPLGTKVWYRFSFFFPKDFPPLDNRTVFAQWKQYAPEDKSPFISFRYINGELSCKIVNSESKNVKNFPKSGDWRDAWHQITTNYQLNTNQQGFVHVLVDGEELVNYEGELGYQSDNPLTYFKMGLYRDQAKPPQTVFFANYCRGFNRQDIVS